MNDEVGPMPDPKSAEPELIPGGTDALEQDPADDGLPRDLDPDANPAVDDVLPDKVAEPDDKAQAPEGDDEDEDPGVAEESEDDSVEPPA